MPTAAIVSLLLADARLPAGGFAHSAGLEPALLGGMPPHAVPAYLRARVRTTALTDAAVAVVARHVLHQGAGSAASVERAWAARTPSPAMRAASRDLGRGLLRLARRLWPASAALAALGDDPAPPRPLVLGAIAAETGIDAATLVRVSVYDDVACAVAALLKLEPGDPAAGVSLTLDACATVEEEIDRIAALTAPDQIPAESAPQAEAWAEDHALTDRRLFRA
ncbi:urease accessory protein UreF [Microbacterium sp. No. 7]|uniref:urease accessory protein UreF n=1 Tax=Microbacterium sp. No. 7 TaxID=1714373 RepID=UPI0006D11083|nr:urease accessory UreF family protein [Microbacterium sp. No. 7]ALJ21569.1 urease accessory protein [Microbacterium sp. No. 7]